MKLYKFMSLGLVAAAIAAPIASNAQIVIDGTDANDHGSVSGGVNQNGWFYMQTVLESLAPQVGVSRPKVLINLGADPGTQAGNAIHSAFNLSTLPGLGWSIVDVNGAGTISSFLTGPALASVAGILYLPTQSNTSGDLTASEMAAINGGASQINAFTQAMGGLFAQGQNGAGGYGWLTTLLPGLVVHASGSTGLTLTPDGNTALPGVTNGQLSSGPWHNYFTGNFGNLLSLANSTPVVAGGHPAVILGRGAANNGGGGITPTVPEPGTIALLIGSGMAGLSLIRRRRSK